MGFVVNMRKCWLALTSKPPTPQDFDVFSETGIEARGRGSLRGAAETPVADDVDFQVTEEPPPAAAPAPSRR